MKIKLESNPVSVYDVDDKKLVMVFVNHNTAAVYLNNKKNRSNYIWSYIQRKTKLKSNRFGRTICFRTANEEQVKLLGDEKYLILDDRYNDVDVKVESGFSGNKIEFSAMQERYHQQIKKA